MDAISGYCTESVEMVRKAYPMLDNTLRGAANLFAAAHSWWWYLDLIAADCDVTLRKKISGPTGAYRRDFTYGKPYVPPTDGAAALAPAALPVVTSPVAAPPLAGTGTVPAAAPAAVGAPPAVLATEPEVTAEQTTQPKVTVRAIPLL